MVDELLAGRSVGEIYRVARRRDLHDFLHEAVKASDGQVLYASSPQRAPVYLGVQLASDERIGMLVYPFRVNSRATQNRPDDEVRGQLRYGSEKSWLREHPIGRDIAGVDVTMILGIDLDDEVILGLDAQLWDPLPMGISFYCKKDDIARAKDTGWYVWEKINRPGPKRAEPRSPTNLETVVAFMPDRLVDYARLERRSTALRLEPALRYVAAVGMREQTPPESPQRHVLEKQFALSSEQILNVINGRNRLSVAVRGGVAEYHLEQQLTGAPGIRSVRRLDVDAMHDFDVTLDDGTLWRVECKNASPKTFASGEFKVEVQKTRASKGDAASRFYAVDAFDVVAACLFSVTGQWEFRFGRTRDMAQHNGFPGRLAAIQKITDDWTDSLPALREKDR
ncbi:hypothetical protein [Flexivirga endophytica]|uniref:hypothetical protein n=1 Tax=Flexivirga endophytica TaxID=1849103 RepID=UPI001666BB60|nr:hypothetical protein [Flexivirga endophytica]